YLKLGDRHRTARRVAAGRSGPAGDPETSLQAVDDAVEPEVERLMPRHRLGQLRGGLVHARILVRRKRGGRRTRVPSRLVSPLVRAEADVAEHVGEEQ